MNLWPWVLFACLLGYATKFVGYLVPASVMKNPRMSRVAGTLTIGLLAALTVTNTFAQGQALVVDARIVALGVGAGALLLRAPFLLVVVAGAAASALARAAGMP